MEKTIQARFFRYAHVMKFAATLALTLFPTALAAQDIGFDFVPDRRIEIPTFSDESVDQLIATLNELLHRPETLENFQVESRIHFWRLANRLKKGVLAAEQEKKINSYLEGLKKEFPDAGELIDRQLFTVNNLMIGKTVPNIVGKDVEGNEFELKDYRGKVVVLYFTGHWCGPCRSEYPYQRLMQELYEDRPFAIVGVNSDTYDVAKTYKEETGLTYRSFWDGPVQDRGPIATAWNVVGWPTVYILDHEGTIRFAGERHEDTLKAVGQLMEELRRAGQEQRD